MRAYLSQSRHSLPWRRHVSRIKVVFLRLDEGMLRLSESFCLVEGLLSLDEPEALPACDSSFASTRVLLRLGEGCLCIDELETWTLLFCSFAAARLFLRLGELIRLDEPETLGADSAFLFFLPFSLLALLLISVKLTQIRD